MFEYVYILVFQPAVVVCAILGKLHQMRRAEPERVRGPLELVRIDENEEDWDDGEIL